MARTYRVRGGYYPRFLLESSRYQKIDDTWIRVHTTLVGDEKKKALARFHSDNGVGAGWLHDEPRWWRNIFEREDRRATARKLQLFMADSLNYEVQVRDKPAMAYYW